MAIKVRKNDDTIIISQKAAKLMTNHLKKPKQHTKTHTLAGKRTFFLWPDTAPLFA